jgi:hypothetical protein
MKYLTLPIFLLASCASAPALAPPVAPESSVQAPPDTVQPELVELPEDQNSAGFEDEDTTDDYCSEFLEEQGVGPADCAVLEDDEDFAIVMKTTDASKPLSTYWAVSCQGLRADRLDMPAGLPASLHSLVLKRDKDIQITWSQGQPPTSGAAVLPLPSCPE